VPRQATRRDQAILLIFIYIFIPIGLHSFVTPGVTRDVSWG
jgi:hypothetical protein